MNKAVKKALKTSLINSNKSLYQNIHTRYQRLKTKTLPDNNLIEFLVKAYLQNTIALKSLSTCVDLIGNKTKAESILSITQDQISSLTRLDQASIYLLQVTFLKNTLKSVLNNCNYSEIKSYQRVLNKVL
jgi:hypothetical protein